MKKETMQRLAEVLGLEVVNIYGNQHIALGDRAWYFSPTISSYFTIERMIRLAIEYRVEIEWEKGGLVICMGKNEEETYYIGREEVTHNGSKEDAERALKEAIALCVIAIKENE